MAVPVWAKHMKAKHFRAHHILWAALERVAAENNETQIDFLIRVLTNAFKNAGVIYVVSSDDKDQAPMEFADYKLATHFAMSKGWSIHLAEKKADDT